MVHKDGWMDRKRTRKKGKNVSFKNVFFKMKNSSNEIAVFRSRKSKCY